MQRKSENMMKGAAVGLAVGAAMGVAGSFVAQQNPKEVKRVIKKAGHTAEKAMQNLDKMMQSR